MSRSGRNDGLWVGKRKALGSLRSPRNAGILRCAQNDDVRLATARTTAKAKATAKARAKAKAKARQRQRQGKGKGKAKAKARQRHRQRRNTGISPLRRQSAPPSVEMTFVMGVERDQATARTRTTARARAGWESLYIPTLGA